MKNCISIVCNAQTISESIPVFTSSPFVSLIYAENGMPGAMLITCTANPIALENLNSIVMKIVHRIIHIPMNTMMSSSIPKYVSSTSSIALSAPLPLVTSSVRLCSSTVPFPNDFISRIFMFVNTFPISLAPPV